MLSLDLAQGPPSVGVPQGLGVNIHFTDPVPGEMARLAGPFRVARMDFAWGATERGKGTYDFAAYDRLLAAMERAGVRPYWILDYGNDLYGEGSPRTPEARDAFCRWTAAALAHFRGQRIVWEMWNEPNIGFWKPKPSVDEYVALALAVGQTFRRAAPKETLIGPATSGFDWAFLQRCLDAGLLKYWDAVSVHPYRQTEPETVEADWLRLRAMLDRAAPGRNVPMISGEWGYSEAWSGQSRERQAEYVARAYLANLRCGVPISVWYDWKDDGIDPKEPEHHFGSVLPDLSPKPAYTAMNGLTKELAGFSYRTRIYTGDGHQWLLLFGRGKQGRLVGWTTGAPSAATLSGGVASLDGSPKVVKGLNLATLLGWQTMPWSTTIDTLADAERATAGQGISSISAGDLEDLGGYAQGIMKEPTGALTQQTRFIVRRPIRFQTFPGRQGGFVARLENPYGRNLSGARYVIAGKTQPAKVGDIPVPEGAPYVDLLVGYNHVRRMTYPVKPMSLDGATATTDGDPKVRGTAEATPNADGIRFAYDAEPGWRFAELHPKNGEVEGRPTAFGLWVQGDGSGAVLRMRYTDATGQTFQPDGGTIVGTGWRYFAFPLDATGGHWGGANDGTVHFPIRVSTLALLELPDRRGGKATITIGRPTLAYAK